MPSSTAADFVLARKMWRTLEPFHAIIYFTPFARERYAALGIEGRSGYFASRVAPMGAVPASVVVSTFFNFNPVLVAASMDGVWTATDPATLLVARLDAADDALRDLLGDAVLTSDALVEAAGLAQTAATACGPEGRPLFGATAGLDTPAEPHLALWHALTLLREYRGDGHLAALVVAGLDGCEALVTHAAGGDVSRQILQATRGWSDDEWDGAVERLRARGLVATDSEELTDAGRALRDGVEQTTDQLAMAPWEAIGAEASDRLRELVRPWSKAVVASGVFFNPAV